MTGIPRTESIIADSTASSSSPSRHTAENQTRSDASALVPPPNQVKRVSRTYGRPKPNNTGDTARDDLGWRARILKTAPRDADAQVIPESDDLNDRDPNFGGFDWRARLKAIDDDFDDSEKIVPIHRPVNSPASLTNDAPDNIENCLHSSVLTPLSGLSHLSLASRDQRYTGTTSPAVAADSLFSGSQCTLLTSNALQDAPRFDPSGDILQGDEHNSVAAPKRPTFSPERVQTSPDPEASSAGNTSPEHPYAINSPNNQSSPTPPTSPFAEEPMSHFAAVSGDDSADDGIKPSNKSRRSTKGKTKEAVKNNKERMKAPTKKDVLESRKESARLLADQHVSIRRTETQTVHTIANLFNKLKNAPTTLIKQDSDPITSFSSPGHLFPIPSRKASLEDTSPSKPSFTASGGISWPTTAINDSFLARSPSVAVETPFYDASDEYLPDPDTLLRGPDEKRKQLADEKIKRAEAERRAKDLEDRKRKALELSKPRPDSQVAPSKTNAKMRVETDSDDDLEIVEDMVTAPARGLMGKGMKSSISKTNTGVRGRRVERENSSSSKVVSQKSLEVAARPAFITSRIKVGSKQEAGQGTFVSHNDLNSLLLRRAGKQSGFIEKRKKELWVKAGGVLRECHSGADAQGKSVIDWLHQGASREDAMAVDEEYDKDDDAEDPEYTPEDVGDRHVEESGDEEDEHETPAQQNMDVSDEESNVETDKENHRPPVRRQSARVIVDSDEEDNLSPRAGPSRTRPVVLVPDTSFAEDSGDSPGEDKENSAELAFDLSEDKENAKVPRHLPRGRVVRADDVSSFLEPSDESGVWTSRQPLDNLEVEGETTFIPPRAQRHDSAQGRILQVLHEEERLPPLSPVTPAKREVPRRNTSSSSPGSVDGHTEDPKVLLGGGFSQLFGSDNSVDGEEPAPATALEEGGFSQFFSPGAVSRESRRKDRTSLVNRSRLAQDNDFQFTQTSILLPSVKISESQRREVDEMFGKDQEFKLDEAKRARDAKSIETRLSSVPGFLDFRSFAPSQLTQLSPPSVRRPLETLSFDSGDTSVPLNASPGDVPLTRGRLLRGRPQRSQASPSPSPVLRNAFDVLRDAARSKAKERTLKPRLEKSEFVEVEAQESDEEAMLGFGGTKGDDDDEGADDDPDAVVQGLVDDTVMDERAQAADLVLEKHMEHQAEDDAIIEKLHQDAVAGKLRGKRRDRGLGFEESDSEDENYKGPKPLYKKRRVEGDTLESYGQNPETRAFYDAYQAELAEEADPRLAHLQQTGSSHLQEGAENDSSEEEETIDSAEVRRQVRELPGRDTSLEPGQELHDLSWLENLDEDMSDDFQVEERPFRIKESAPQVIYSFDHLDHMGASTTGKKHHAAEQAKLKSWATQEARSHSSTSGRGGFSRKEDADKGASQKQRRSTTTSKISAADKDERTVVAKKSSLMSQMEKRKGFDS